MFPQAPAPAESFSVTFRPASSEEEDDDDPIGPGIRRFASSTPMPSGSGHGSSPALSSTPLFHGGCFILVSDWKEALSTSLSTPPLEGEEPEMQPLDEDLHVGLDTDDEGDGEKDPGVGNDTNINAIEVEKLNCIINLGVHDQAPTMPKSGEKWGSGHHDSSIGCDSSGEDLDAKDAWNRKKGSTPIKVASNTGQWTEEDLNVVCQLPYKTDLDRFRTYRCNKITPADLSTIHTKDHSTYIEVAKADPGTVIKISVFSVAAYQEVLRQKGSDTSKFDRVGGQFQEVGERVLGAWHWESGHRPNHACVPMREWHQRHESSHGDRAWLWGKTFQSDKEAKEEGLNST